MTGALCRDFGKLIGNNFMKVKRSAWPRVWQKTNVCGSSFEAEILQLTNNAHAQSVGHIWYLTTGQHKDQIRHQIQYIYVNAVQNMHTAKTEEKWFRNSVNWLFLLSSNPIHTNKINCFLNKSSNHYRTTTSLRRLEILLSRGSGWLLKEPF